MSEKTTTKSVLMEMLEKVNPVKSATGLIAVFDILGYQQILENNENEIEAVANIISDKLSKLPEYIFNFHNKVFSDFMNRLGKVFESNLEWKTFSDTIMVFMPLEKRISPNRLSNLWLYFLLFCEDLFKEMFFSGLPLRGTISYGKYYFTHNCFAGKPIVECYKESKEQDWCGCILTKEAQIYFRNTKLTDWDLLELIPKPQYLRNEGPIYELLWI